MLLLRAGAGNQLPCRVTIKPLRLVEHGAFSKLPVISCNHRIRVPVAASVTAANVGN